MWTHTQKIICRDVKFYEHLFPFSRNSDDAYFNVWNEQFLYDDVSCDVRPAPEHEPQSSIDSSLVEPESEHDDDDELSESSDVPQESVHILRRFGRATRPPIWHNDYHVESSNSKHYITNCVAYAHLSLPLRNFVSCLSRVTKSNSFAEIEKHSEWVQAMKNE